MLALVGESGSGKSVTGKAILGLLPDGARMHSGTIRYRGKNIIGLSEDGMREIRGRKISVVPQDPFLSLDPITRVGEQIAESIPGYSERGRVKKDEIIKETLRLMREVGIRDPEIRYKNYPFELSGGQRQRIAIAAALAPSPEILICDEPTTALDVTIEAQILDLFLRLKSERGLSMIFITHDLGVVARVADRVAVMYAGKIVEVGEVEEIFYDPKHPYTVALLSSLPSSGVGRLKPIPGAVPDMRHPPRGDAFAARNENALKIDYYIEPPFLDVTPTHRVASWSFFKELRERGSIEKEKHADGESERRGE